MSDGQERPVGPDPIDDRLGFDARARLRPDRARSRAPDAVRTRRGPPRRPRGRPADPARRRCSAGGPRPGASTATSTRRSPAGALAGSARPSVGATGVIETIVARRSCQLARPARQTTTRRSGCRTRSSARIRSIRSAVAVDLAVAVLDDVVVVLLAGQLDRRVALAQLELVGRLGRPRLQPLEEALERRRDDEDQHGVGDVLLDHLGALDVDLEDHVAAGEQGLADLARGVPYQLPWTSLASSSSPASRSALNWSTSQEVVAQRRRPRRADAAGSCRSRRSGSRGRWSRRRSASMTASLPTPDGPEMMTSIAPGAPATPGSAPVRLTGRYPTPIGSSYGRSRRPEPVEDRLELGRQRRRRPDQVAVAEARSSSSRQACRNSRSRPVRSAPRRAGAVDRVAGDRVADRLEVDPDLVGPPGDQVELEQGPAGEALADAVAGHRRPAVRDDGHPGPLLRIAADRRLDPADVRGDAALDERQVGLLHPARLELGHQAGLGGVVLGDHQQAARVAVEAMDDPRAGARRRSRRTRRPPARPSRALTRVPAGWPGDGWTTRPAGLSTISRSSSS